jgi:hypothetical protein
MFYLPLIWDADPCPRISLKELKLQSCGSNGQIHGFMAFITMCREDWTLDFVSKKFAPEVRMCFF